ncbi:hypothetical protein WJX72_000765 [[Myrmecia] bisecta]|uniref:Uncharacterized protein n=1 Tax=[Myrmecia] bisecta TaxID=41462 RepID=A0AAW1PCF4_9CHLO
MSTGGAGSSQLTFASPRDELAYHVYIGKASARGARWQRLLCGTVWSMHCFKLVILMLQLVRARARLLWMLAFAVPMLFIEYGAAAISHVRPAWSAIYHENVKVAVQLCNITTVLVSIIMSKPVSYATKSPLEVMLCLSAVQVFGQMRLATAANVYPIMAAAYMFMEVSQWLLDESGQAIIYPLGNLAIYLAFGIVLPVLLACAFEARSRHNFLIRHRQPLTKLGPFWQRVHSATVALESRLQERFNTLSPLVSAIFRIVGEDSLHFRYAQAACADPKLAGYHGYPVKPGQQLSWQRGQQAQHAAQQPAKPMPMPAPVAPVQQPGQTQQQRRKVRACALRLARARQQLMHSVPDDTVRYNTILAGIGSCLFMIVLLALTEKYAPEEYNRLWVAVSSFFFFD